MGEEGGLARLNIKTDMKIHATLPNIITTAVSQQSASQPAYLPAILPLNVTSYHSEK